MLHTVRMLVQLFGIGRARRRVATMRAAYIELEDDRRAIADLIALCSQGEQA